MILIVGQMNQEILNGLTKIYYHSLRKWRLIVAIFPLVRNFDRNKIDKISESLDKITNL